MKGSTQHPFIPVAASVHSLVRANSARCSRLPQQRCESWGQEKGESQGERINHSSGHPAGCGEWGCAAPAPLTWSVVYTPAWPGMLLWCVSGPRQAEGQRECGTFPSPCQTHSNFSAFQSASKEEIELKIAQERETVVGQRAAWVRLVLSACWWLALNPPLPQPVDVFKVFCQMPDHLPAFPLLELPLAAGSAARVWHPSSTPSCIYWSAAMLFGSTSGLS